MRHQLSGPEEIEAALGDGTALRLILVSRAPADPRSVALCERARARGIEVREVSENDLRRMARHGAPDLLGLCAAPPRGLDDTLAEGGAFWLLTGVAYPGNAGYAIRTAEVSGATGIAIDAPFDSAEQKRALRFSMHANRFYPVFWEAAAPLLARAKAHGRPRIAIEDVGRSAPWDVDLRGNPLLVIGGEREGIAPSLLAECDEIVRIPMAGFIPAYNMQAAMAAVASERLRQLETSQ